MRYSVSLHVYAYMQILEVIENEFNGTQVTYNLSGNVHSNITDITLCIYMYMCACSGECQV